VSAAATDLLVSSASHGLAALAFAGFAAVLLIGRNQQGPGLYLVVACLTTAAWCAVVAAASFLGQSRSLPELLLELLRSAAWTAFLYRLLRESATQHGAQLPHLMVAIAGLLFASIATGDAIYQLTDNGLAAGYAIIGRLVVAILALTLIENLARNDWPHTQWSARFMFVGLGGIFAYDLFVYSEALLFRRVNLELYAVRGAVDMITVPLLAVSFARNPSFAVKIHVSRQFVFHTMTLAGTGVYLLLMAIAGYYLRNFGGTWGTLLQVTFFSGALALVFLTLSSGTFRSAVRNFVSANFFNYKYDYRHEWLQFIRLISAQESLLPLHDRVIEALANIVDSPAGALWLLHEDAYVNTASWNAPLYRETGLLDPSLAEWFDGNLQIIDLIDGGSERPAQPDWLTGLPRAWVVVPLMHRHRLLGLLVLALPRAPRRLDDEDQDLLTTVGSQAASYLAEEETARALLDARQLELFNQRFAFVVHDIKNLVSQLSLILSNVERHGDNPEFQRDVIDTVRHSVSRMKGLLEQISQTRRAAPASTVTPVATDLAALIDKDWGDRRLHPSLRVIAPEGPCPVLVDAEALSQVLRHVIQNALEAISDTGRVELRLQNVGKHALLKVIDDGPGMTAEFIRDVLFRPFGTTKKSGYGIGAHQARELIRGMGGRLEVASTVGSGTEITIHLPLAPVDAKLPQVQEA